MYLYLDTFVIVLYHSCDYRGYTTVIFILATVYTHTHTHIYIYIYIYIYISSSSSSCSAASTDIPGLISPLLPIVHRLWQVFRAASRILTELLYVCSSWSSCFYLAMCGVPSEYITYELVPVSPAVSCMSCS